MGRLVQLELQDFKSYKGRQVIGPFYDFTSIIGPNGAGKSNLMDAISFVLGVKSMHLRSQHLSELIYRGTATSGAAALAECEVSLIFEDDNGVRIAYKRIARADNTSQYEIDGRTVLAKAYLSALEKHNILVRARNFLVFQGDIESVASQSPKDLTRLIEQISGSLEYRQQYDTLKIEYEKAVEESAYHFTKKRGVNAEMRTWQEQKREAEAFEATLAKKQEAVLSYTLWKLHQFEQAAQETQTGIESHSEQQRELAEQVVQLEGELSRLQASHAKAIKSVIAREKQLKVKQKQQQEQQPETIATKEKIDITIATIDKYSKRLNQVQAEEESQLAQLNDIKRQISKMESANAAFESKAAQDLESRQAGLEGDDLEEYKALSARVQAETVEQQLQLERVSRECRISKQILDSSELKAASIRSELTKAKERLQEFNARFKNDIQKAAEIQESLQQKKEALEIIHENRARLIQRERETNEKLEDCLKQLAEADAVMTETRTEMRNKQILAELKRQFSGVHGSVSELVRPVQSRYGPAVSSILGRHLDSIVVNNQATAKDCLAYLRDGRKGQATFIPLNGVVAGSINTQLRDIHKEVRLAIDVLEYDQMYRRVVDFVCGNAIVCDTLQVAREMCYERGLKVKAASIDGSLIHKSGMITGGMNSKRSGNKWDSLQIEAMRKLRDNLIAELGILAAERRKTFDNEEIKLALAQLESQHSIMIEEMNATERQRDSARREVEMLQKNLDSSIPKCEEAKAKLSEKESNRQAIETSINSVEDEIFSEFCTRIGYSDIRRYNEEQGFRDIEQESQRSKLKTQLQTLNSRLAFETGRTEELKQRLAGLRGKIKTQEALLRELRATRQELLNKEDQVTAEIDILQEDLKQSRSKANRAFEQVEKKSVSKNEFNSEHERVSRLIASAKDEIQRLKYERYSLLRKCKLEDINLPLLQGSLAALPLHDASAMGTDGMEIDTDESEEAANFAPDKYGISVDYSSLTRRQLTGDHTEIENEFMDKISNFSAEIEKLHPNLKAIDRFEGVQDRAHMSESEWQRARKDAKRISDKFETIRRKRYELFQNAFTHISEQIDPIYKELTRSETFPLGGTAYLTLEDSEDPFLHGIKYHAMPPTKRFRDIDQLSGGEKSIAALALLFAIHSYQPSPFFVLDEVDAALDQQNVARVATYIRNHAGAGFQFIVISLSAAFFSASEALVGVYREQAQMNSRSLTLELEAR